MSSSDNYAQHYSQGGSQQYSQSYSQPRTRVAQNPSPSISAATSPAGAATQRRTPSTPRSLTSSLQQIPTGPTPLQYYAGKMQAFEQVPIGYPTSRKNMDAHLQSIMRPFDGGRR